MKYRVLLASLALVTSSFASSAEADFALVRNSETMLNIMSEVSENYVDEVDTDKLMKEISVGISAYLDPFSNYIAHSDIQEFEMMTTGKYGGIGAMIRQRGDDIVISRPYKGSPADRSGLVVGDRIVSINGEPIAGLSSSEVSDRLKGVAGSKVKVVMERLVSGKQEKILIQRENITIPSIPYYGMLSDSVGYIQHTDFTEGCSYDMRRAVVKLRRAGMKSLILDYRNNGGGIMQEAIKILSLFLPKGTEVLEVKSRRDSTIYRTEQDPIAEDLPITVLINNNSASAAEIVSGALQDLDRALLIGQRSYGKGLVQSTLDVGYGSYMMLTTARYYIPSGRCIQAINYNENESPTGKLKPVADSLRREFHTAAGRTVLDGGGITPDVKMRVDALPRFAATLYGNGYIEDYGNEYYRLNSTLKPEIASFKITDEDYEAFSCMIDSCKMDYESSSRMVLTKLRRTLELEAIEGLEAEMEAIEQALRDDTRSNLERYRSEITALIERDLISRYYYAEGGIQYSLRSDEAIERALELLGDHARYQEIMSKVE